METGELRGERDVLACKIRVETASGKSQKLEGTRGSYGIIVSNSRPPTAIFDQLDLYDVDGQAEGVLSILYPPCGNIGRAV
jgi:hypothetical protein